MSFRILSRVLLFCCSILGLHLCSILDWEGQEGRGWAVLVFWVCLVGWFCLFRREEGKIELIFMKPGMESRALHILGKNSVTELHLNIFSPGMNLSEYIWA